MSELPLLSLPEAVNAIAAHRAEQTQPLRQAGPQIPRIIFQYWDKNPPPQIWTLILRNQELCKKHGIEHRLFNDEQARDIIRTNFDKRVLKAYDGAVHPAMKCDIFRLAYLHLEGGYYVDADIVLRTDFPLLFDEPGHMVVFQWDSKNLTNVCNWLIGCAPGHPGMRFIAECTAISARQACKTNPEGALKNILMVSGPGVFTRSLGTWLRRHRSADAASTVNIQTVSFAHTMIQTGPGYLKSPLNYKSDGRHWLAAIRGQAGVSTDFTDKLRGTWGRWAAGLRRRFK